MTKILPYVYDNVKTVYSFSDIHGDIDSMIISLRDCAKVIRAKSGDLSEYQNIALQNLSVYNPSYDDSLGYEWVGDDTFIVIIGDILHGSRNTSIMIDNSSGISQRDGEYGNDEVKILRFLTNMGQQAELNGGKIIKLLGNHELRDLENPDWSEMFHSQLTINQQYAISPTKMVSRRELFNGNNALELLANKSEGLDFGIIAKINDFVFVHGGLTKNIPKIGLTDEQSDDPNYIIHNINLHFNIKMKHSPKTSMYNYPSELININQPLINVYVDDILWNRDYATYEKSSKNYNIDEFFTMSLEDSDILLKNENEKLIDLRRDIPNTSELFKKEESRIINNIELLENKIKIFELITLKKKELSELNKTYIDINFNLKTFDATEILKIKHFQEELIKIDKNIKIIIEEIKNLEYIIMNLEERRDIDETQRKMVNSEHCKILYNVLQNMCSTCTNLKLVVGHCMQSLSTQYNSISITYKKVKKYIDPYTKQITHISQSDDKNSGNINDHIYMGYPKINDDINVFGMAVDCLNPGLTHISPSSFNLYKVDVGSSRAFDDINMFKIDGRLINEYASIEFVDSVFLQKLKNHLVKFFYARCPSVLRIEMENIPQNKYDMAVIRSGIRNAFKFQPRYLFQFDDSYTTELFDTILNEIDNGFELNTEFSEKYKKYHMKTFDLLKSLGLL